MGHGTADRATLYRQQWRYCAVHGVRSLGRVDCWRAALHGGSVRVSTHDPSALVRHVSHIGALL
jgi:hypothetical protein